MTNLHYMENITLYCPVFEEDHVARHEFRVDPNEKSFSDFFYLWDDIADDICCWVVNGVQLPEDLYDVPIVAFLGDDRVFLYPVRKIGGRA